MAGPSKRNGKQSRQKKTLKDYRKKMTSPSFEVYFRTGIDIFSFKPVIIKHLIE